MGIIDRVFSKRINQATEAAVEKALEYSTDQIMRLIQTGSIRGNQNVNDPYSQIVTVYACVRVKAMNLSRVPVLVKRGDTIVETGPAVDLIKKLNPYMGFPGFMYYLSSGVNLRKNVYAYWDDVRAGLPVTVIPVIDAKPIIDGLMLEGYEIELDKRKIRKPPEMVVDAKFPSPTSLIAGHTPLDSLRQKMELQFAADGYNIKFFQNDATPTSVFTVPPGTGEKNLEPLREQLIERRRGERDTMLLSGGVDVKSVGLSQKDADFLNLYKLTREEIASAYGVPESEIDIYTETKYSNAQTAAASFWEKTLIPEGDLIVEALNQKIFRPGGFEISLDYNSIDAIHNKGYGDKVEQATKLAEMRVPFQAINDRLNLGFDEDIELDPVPMAPQVERDFSLLEDVQGKKWKRLDDKIRSIEARFRKKLKDYFHRVEGRILRAIGEGKGHDWKVRKDFSESDINDAFDDDELEELARVLLGEAITVGAAEIAGEALASGPAREILEGKLIKVVETNGTGRGIVADKLREVIDESISAGDSVADMAKKLKESLKETMKRFKGRAEMIARTETVGAFNQAGYKGVVESEAESIRWISSRDSRVRDSHMAYDGMKVRVGEEFAPGLQYPHDPDAPASEVINCRCVIEPIFEEES